MCSEELWFDQGLPFPQGLVVVVSADQYELELLSEVPPGLELKVEYKTDAEIAREATKRALWERRPDDPHSVAVSLPEFLRTGHLGPIQLGMTRTVVVETLGRPDDWSTTDNPDGRPAIFKYGDIEFYFGDDDDALICVRADNFDLLSGGAALRFDPWILRRGTPQHEVEAQLALEGISYQRTVRPRDPPDVIMITAGAGVEFGFAPQPHDEAAFGLWAFSWDGGRTW